MSCGTGALPMRLSNKFYLIGDQIQVLAGTGDRSTQVPDTDATNSSLGGRKSVMVMGHLSRRIHGTRPPMILLRPLALSVLMAMQSVIALPMAAQMLEEDIRGVVLFLHSRTSILNC